MCKTTGAGQTPGPFSVSRHLLFLLAARCWPSAGLLVGGQLACRQVTPGKPGCGLPLQGHRGPGPVRASVLLPRVLTEAGVTPAVHLRGPAPLAASPAQPVSESGKNLQNSPCPAGRGEQTPTPVKLATYMDTLGHADAPAACIVLEGSGRAGPSVAVNASRREKKDMCIPQLALHLKKRTSISTFFTEMCIPQLVLDTWIRRLLYDVKEFVKNPTS